MKTFSRTTTLLGGGILATLAMMMVAFLAIPRSTYSNVASEVLAHALSSSDLKVSFTEPYLAGRTFRSSKAQLYLPHAFLTFILDQPIAQLHPLALLLLKSNGTVTAGAYEGTVYTDISLMPFTNAGTLSSTVSSVQLAKVPLLDLLGITAGALNLELLEVSWNNGLLSTMSGTLSLERVVKGRSTPPSLLSTFTPKGSSTFPFGIPPFGRSTIHIPFSYNSGLLELQNLMVSAQEGSIKGTVRMTISPHKGVIPPTSGELLVDLSAQGRRAIGPLLPLLGKSLTADTTKFRVTANNITSLSKIVVEPR